MSFPLRNERLFGCQLQFQERDIVLVEFDPIILVRSGISDFDGVVDIEHAACNRA